MRSLFAKILLWFLAAMTITGIAWLVAATIAMTATHPRNMPYETLTGMQLREAVRAYEAGGVEELERTMSRLFEDSGMSWILTDGEGMDLLTGEDRSQLIRQVSRRRLLPPRFGNWMVLERQSDNGRYWYFLLMPRQRWTTFIFRPVFLLVFALAALLCYLLAAHLTAPVRRLQQAVERFGRGDLDSRVHSKRADELGHLARTFDEMADRIQSLVKSQRRLMQDISHELRSPLARLSVAAELARSGDRREEALDQIEKESNRMNTLIGELLRVTRAEGDPGTLELQRTDVTELVRQIVADAAVEAEAKDCVVVFSGSAPLPLPVDEELIRRAVDNVIRNAIQHSPAGETIAVTIESRSATVTITVADRGPGVPHDSLPHVFDAFYRVDRDRNRSTGGAGLGLSIARRAVELHKGAISARNTAPGLAVEITLPAAG